MPSRFSKQGINFINVYILFYQISETEPANEVKWTIL